MYNIPYRFYANCRKHLEKYTYLLLRIRDKASAERYFFVSEPTGNKIFYARASVCAHALFTTFYYITKYTYFTIDCYSVKM